MLSPVGAKKKGGGSTRKKIPSNARFVSRSLLRKLFQALLTLDCIRTALCVAEARIFDKVEAALFDLLYHTIGTELQRSARRSDDIPKRTEFCESLLSTLRAATRSRRDGNEQFRKGEWETKAGGRVRMRKKKFETTNS